LEDSLDADALQAAVDSLQWTRLALTMPRFTMESSFSLKDALSALGMVNAFTPGVADFSGMDGTRELYVGDVVHKAFVEVDEAGTEAAAATAVIMQATAMPASLFKSRSTGPSFFLIRDIETGTSSFSAGDEPGLTCRHGRGLLPASLPVSGSEARCALRCMLSRPILASGTVRRHASACSRMAQRPGAAPPADAGEREPHRGRLPSRRRR
jgi:hypothetical protein